MNERNIAFPSESQYEYNTKKIKRIKPHPPILNWEIDTRKELNNLDINNEELVKKNILEYYQTMYQILFRKRDGKNENKDAEDQDFENELINFINKLYFPKTTKEPYRVLYSTTRLFGYVSPFILKNELSSYQDTYGRTGSKVMLKNAKKILLAKQKQMTLLRLKANLDPINTEFNK